MTRQLNVKLIVLFFISLWLFANAGEVLGYLGLPSLAEQIRQAKGDTTVLIGEGLTIISINSLLIASGVGSLTGLLVGLVTSLVICRRCRLQWVNAVLALLLVYAAGYLPIGKMNFVSRLLRMPGEPFAGIGYYLINGFVSLILALLTLNLVRSMKRPDADPGVNAKPKGA